MSSPDVDYDDDAGRGPPDGRGLPRPVPRRADLPARADQGGAHRVQRVDRGAHLRAGPRACCGRRPQEVERRIADVDGVVDAHAVAPDRPAAHRGRARPGRRPALRADAGRHPPAVVDDDRERGGQRHLRRRPGLRRARDGDPVGAATASPTSRTCRSTPRAGDRVLLKDVADVRLAPTPNAIERENQSRRIDVGANVAGRRPRRRRRRRGGAGSRASTFPRGYHAEVLGESDELGGRAQPAAAVRLGGAGRHPAAAAGRVRQHAARAAHLPAAADGAGRRRAGGLARRRRALARLAGRLPHRVRHRRPQRHPA